LVVSEVGRFFLVITFFSAILISQPVFSLSSV
jgi:hypothetical protein